MPTVHKGVGMNRAKKRKLSPLVPGSIVVEEGRVTRISPHSGHFIPTRGEYDALLDELRGRGLDLSKTEIRGLVKEK